MKHFLVIVLSAIIFSACNGINGSGNIKSEHRTVNQFEGVRTSGSIDVEIKNGESSGVEVEADDNILPFIVTDVKNGLLEVYYKSGNFFNNVHAKVYVTAASLKKLYSSGSADIIAKEGIKNDDKIDIRVSGSGNINAQVNAPTIQAAVSGSGNLVLQGHTKIFDCTVSGSGDAKCGDLLSENTTIHVSGSGNAHVYASVSLKASAGGSGEIRYRGSPPDPEIHSSGSGSVQPEK
jgi:Putative auto-transporter adhesin, head GIN domain